MADFFPGERVRVREDFPPGHIRTPVYVRGKEGVVKRKFGKFPNPEVLALGRDGMPAKALYEVRFRQADLWPDYAGADTDTLDIDIYEHWLAKL
jgi:nitrile hydratase subunit beta